MKKQIAKDTIGCIILAIIWTITIIMLSPIQGEYEVVDTGSGPVIYLD